MGGSKLSTHVGELPLARCGCLRQASALQPIESPACTVLINELSTREHLPTLLVVQPEDVSDSVAHIAHRGRYANLREKSQDGLDAVTVARECHYVTVPSASAIGGTLMTAGWRVRLFTERLLAESGLVQSVWVMFRRPSPSACRRPRTLRDRGDMGE